MRVSTRNSEEQEDEEEEVVEEEVEAGGGGGRRIGRKRGNDEKDAINGERKGKKVEEERGRSDAT